MNFAYRLVDITSQTIYQSDGTWQSLEKSENPVIFTSRQSAETFKAEVLHLGNCQDIIPDILTFLPSCSLQGE